LVSYLARVGIELIEEPTFPSRYFGELARSLIDDTELEWDPYALPFANVAIAMLDQNFFSQ